MIAPMFMSCYFRDANEAPRSPASAGRIIKAEFRSNQPGFALKSYAAVRLAVHLFSPESGIAASLRQETGYFGEGE